MKNPLSYQVTEYDCGPTSVMNAMSYLFNRDEISPDIVKNIMMYCLDGYNHKGEAYKRGTTDTAMWFVAHWLNQFGKARKFPIYCEVVSKEEVHITQNSRIVSCLQQKGAVVAKVMLGGWHFVLLTDIDDEFVYLFDPYYRQKPFTVEGIENIWDQPKKMNKKVRISYFNTISRGYYSLGQEEQRECVLVYNTHTRMTMDSIEYII